MILVLQLALWERSICPSVNLELLQSCAKRTGFVQFQPFRNIIGYSTLHCDCGRAIAELQSIKSVVQVLHLFSSVFWNNSRAHTTCELTPHIQLLFCDGKILPIRVCVLRYFVVCEIIFFFFFFFFYKNSMIVQRDAISR